MKVVVATGKVVGLGVVVIIGSIEKRNLLSLSGSHHERTVSLSLSLSVLGSVCVVKNKLWTNKKIDHFFGWMV